MNKLELEKYLWGVATFLRGKIDAGDYKQYIFPLLFYKRICDVYDEEINNALIKSKGDLEFAKFKENHHFQIPENAHWNKIREVTVNIGNALQNALRSIEKANPNLLTGIFGDASWTNKNRLSDEILINLIDHFSKHDLNLSNVPSDQLGEAYEYLIKKFADDSGHTAAEFYTNRTVVILMTKIMNPQASESVYDPTCGSGGLLLNCALHLKKQKKEYRTLKLYGQEINLITSSIARMNMFLHGIEEFSIIRGDTLSNPGFIENEEIKKFNIILANPPYSVKSWDYKSFENDTYGRNIWGNPPRGCADYAFQQHIQKSLNVKNGRACVLWPYGVLFRDSEKKMRAKMVKDDLVECVISLGKNLFYNSTMESCLLITNNNKHKNRRGKILFIDARKELIKEKSISYLSTNHISKIYNTFKEYSEIDDFSKIATLDDVLKKDANLNIPLYVKKSNIQKQIDTTKVYNEWLSVSEKIKSNMSIILKNYEY